MDRTVEFHIKAVVPWETPDSRICDIRDEVVLFVESHPDASVMSYSAHPLRNDGTAISGEPITKDPVEILTERFAQAIADLRESTGVEFRVEHTGGGCFWLIGEKADRVFTVTEFPEVLSMDSTPESAHRNGWLLGVATLEQHADGSAEMFPWVLAEEGLPLSHVAWHIVDEVMGR